MNVPRVAPYDPCGIALRFAAVDPETLVALAESDGLWGDAVIASHELWCGEDDSERVAHLSIRQWDVSSVAWPTALVRAVQHDPNRPVRLLCHTADDQLIALLSEHRPPPIRVLSLVNADVGSAACLEAIATSLVDLEELDLSNTRAKARSLAMLQPLKGLKKLYLSAINIRAGKEVAALSGLECLAMKANASDLMQLGDMTSLKELDLTQSSLGGVDSHQFARLACFRQLEKLSLRMATVSADALAVLLPILEKNLVELDLSCIDGVGSSFDAIEGMRRLEVLMLHRVSDVGDAVCSRFKGMPNLKELHLGHTAVTCAGLKHLADNLTTLEKLSLVGTAVADSGIATLCASSCLILSLKELDISETGVTDDGLRQLHKLRALKVLVLRETAVTDAGMVHLVPLKSHLLSLDVHFTSVTDARLDALELPAW